MPAVGPDGGQREKWIVLGNIVIVRPYLRDIVHTGAFYRIAGRIISVLAGVNQLLRMPYFNLAEYEQQSQDH